jgi:membrane-associated phospholipid phosphatase
MIANDVDLDRIMLTRRRLLGYTVAGGVLGALRPLDGRAAPSRSPAPPEGWRTWLLSSADELRPAAPEAPSRAEIDELLDLQALRTASASEIVARWDGRAVVLPWTDLALDLIKTHKPSPVRAGRALALLHVALYDTIVATRDARAAYPRRRPVAIEPAIVPLRSRVADAASFPSEHAGVASAAAMVLAYLFPDEPGEKLTELEHEAGASRLLAGANFRSDIEAGRAIGRAVAARAITRGQADGSDVIWDSTSRPPDEGYWRPTPPAFIEQPLDPLAGTWKPWVLPSGAALRPPPPPTWGSPAWQSELVAVQEAVARRTPEQAAAAQFWAGYAGTVTPAGLWTEIARDLIVRDGLDAPHAARVLALTSVAMADGFVCCWDAKYAYWSARPITADPSLDVLIPTPPFPSYTSGHSTISGAAATVLAHLFPADEGDLRARAEEAKNSRLWAGIHYPIDNDMGALGGGRVGRLVVAGARGDGEE